MASSQERHETDGDYMRRLQAEIDQCDADDEEGRRAAQQELDEFQADFMAEITRGTDPA